MLLPFVIAATAALIWALLAAFSGAGDFAVPHDPTSLELAGMALVTLVAYAWNRQIRQIRREAASLGADDGQDLPYASPRGAEPDTAQEHAA